MCIMLGIVYQYLKTNGNENGLSNFSILHIQINFNVHAENVLKVCHDILL